MIFPTIQNTIATTKFVLRSHSQSAAAIPSTISSSIRWAQSSLNAADVQLRSRKFTAEITSLSLNQILRQDDQGVSDLAYCLSFANNDSDFKENFAKLFPGDLMQRQLSISNSQLRNYNKQAPSTAVAAAAAAVAEVVLDTAPLPRTLQEALRPSSRAIVITEAAKPFRIVDVNKAWEELCGFSYVEARDQTLGSLLGGPDTDRLAATALIAQLLHGEQAGTTLTNYTKDHEPFRNRLQAGPLTQSEGSEVTHFVGVLQRV